MSITFKQVAETAQKYVAVCPVIILGSGASIRHGVPSMSGLAEQRLVVARIEELAAKIDDANRLRSEAELDALLPSILNKAFKGEL